MCMNEDIAVWRWQAVVQEFQENADVAVLLLTTQVGGLGLTLTAATRVVIIGGCIAIPVRCNVIPRWLCERSCCLCV